jgi:hypothetical protein
MQNEHTQILSFLAIHDLIPLLVSDLVQHLLADVVSLLAPTLHWVTSWHSWWRMVAPLGADPGQQNGWVQHASCPGLPSFSTVDCQQEPESLVGAAEAFGCSLLVLRPVKFGQTSIHHRQSSCRKVLEGILVHFRVSVV